MSNCSWLISGKDIEALDMTDTWVWQDAKIDKIINPHTVRVKWQYKKKFQFTDETLPDLRRPSGWPIREKQCFVGVSDAAGSSRRAGKNHTVTYKKEVSILCSLVSKPP
jgi:hypothetical protein